MNPPVSFALDGAVALVTLDDGKANALTLPAIEALGAALTRAEAEAAAMVLCGRPERFCAGFDLRAMMGGPAAATDILRRGSELFLRLYSTPLPLVVACTGHALAGGALVLLCGDVRVGAAGPYKIGLNEVAIGMPLPVLGVELARARLPLSELTRATLGAHIHDPESAVRAGFLDEVVAPGELFPRATAEAARLGKLSRPAYGATKDRLRGATVARIRETLESDMAGLMGLLGAVAAPR